MNDRYKRRSSSIYSTSSNSTEKKEAESSKAEDMNEIVKNQKIKQFKNLVKLEQSQNTAHITYLNNLQDSDLKELIQFIDNFFSNCFKLINSRDKIISASVNQNASQNEDFTIKIESILSVDFLRNGIKSGNPLANHAKIEFKPDTSQNQSIQLPKIPESKVISNNNSANTSLLSINNRQPTNQSITQQTHNQTFLNLNYLLVLDLNKTNFKMELEEFNFSRINLIKQPEKCTNNDYEQLSIEIKTQQKEKSKKSKTSTYFSKTKVRCLNSKSIFDRLLRYFSHVLKHDWPPRPKTYNQSIPKLPTLLDLNEKSEETRKCYLKNNQIIVSFKWNGSKSLKDIYINLYIDLAIKLENENEFSLITNNLRENLIRIINQYLKDSNLDLIKDNEQFNKLINWLATTLNINLKNVYLQPTFLHLWTLNTKLLKLNLVKFLIWFDSIRSIQTNISSINDLLSLNIQGLRQSYLQIIQNSNGSLFLFVKLNQLFLNTCFTSLREEHSSKLDDSDKELLDSDLLQFDNEELLLNLMLIEISTSGPNWNTNNLLDRIWTCLTRLRSFLFIYSNMPDPFNLYSNQLPKFYLKCIGYHMIDSPSASQILSNKVLNYLKASYETTMRTLLTKVITEEIDFTQLERSKSEVNARNNISPVVHKDIRLKNEKNDSNAATKASSLTKSQINLL